MGNGHGFLICFWKKSGILIVIDLFFGVPLPKVCPRKTQTGGYTCCSLRSTGAFAQETPFRNSSSRSGNSPVSTSRSSHAGCGASLIRKCRGCARCKQGLAEKQTGNKKRTRDNKKPHRAK